MTQPTPSPSWNTLEARVHARSLPGNDPTVLHIRIRTSNGPLAPALTAWIERQEVDWASILNGDVQGAGRTISLRVVGVDQGIVLRVEGIHLPMPMGLVARVLDSILQYIDERLPPLKMQTETYGPWESPTDAGGTS